MFETFIHAALAMDTFAVVPLKVPDVLSGRVSIRLSEAQVTSVAVPWRAFPLLSFATGPVRVYMGPVRLDSVRENLDRSDNLLTFRAERYVLAIWDTALQAAALVDWST